jgi:adenosine deaminase
VKRGRVRQIYRSFIALRSIALTCLGFVALLVGQVARADTMPVTAPVAAREAAVAALFDKAAQSPPALRMFLRRMPKGGDLHNHLGGNIYAEDFLRWAATDGLCADGTRLIAPPCAAGHSIKDITEHQPDAYAALVDAFSTRGWQQGVGRNAISGHDQFFATFEKFGPADRGHTADALVLTRRVAAGDRLSYLELDYNPQALDEYVMATPEASLDEAGLAARYARELPGIGAVVTKGMAQVAADEADGQRQLGCAGPRPEAACTVSVHYITYALRALSPAAVFRQLMLGFALTEQDPRFVAVNIVQPEDWAVPLRDYDLHMAMFRFLEGKYPGVHRSLHAGELTLGLVPPEDLRNHIAKAIVAGGAQRIGHGTDIAYEDDAAQTMARMARDGIAVEINLSSNDTILGVKGTDHPLQLYRRFGVPFVLSSDDQGVLRGDMTNEYVRAAREQGLRYADLKAAARASLEYSFMPGSSLWVSHRLGTPAGACARSFVDGDCRRLAAHSEKATAQLALETQLDNFEKEKLAEDTY